MIFNTRTGFNYKYNPYKIGTTDVCEYIPIYAALSLPRYAGNMRFQRENSEGLPLVEITGTPYYQVQALKSKGVVQPSSRYKTYPDFFELLKTNRGVSSFEIKYQDEKYYIGITTGFILDSYGNILLALCTKKPKELFKEDGTVDFDNIRLMISSEMKSNPIYKNLFKKLDSDYIAEFYENHSEVLFTTSSRIESKLYGNNFGISFNSLTELEETLKPANVMKNLFYYENPNYMVVEANVDDLFGEESEPVPLPDEIIQDEARPTPQGLYDTYTMGIDYSSVADTILSEDYTSTEEEISEPTTDLEDSLREYFATVEEVFSTTEESTPQPAQFVLVDEEGESTELELESQNGTEEAEFQEDSPIEPNAYSSNF